MKIMTWNQRRSEFNHAWLKNRVLISLWKAQNVLSGTVEDESIWEDLTNLLMEWQDRRGDAQRILADFATAASPAKELRQPSLSALDADMKEWLGQVVEQRWKEVDLADSKASRAAAALIAFDCETRTFSSLISAVRSGQEVARAKDCLATFQSATKELAEALSELAPAGV